MLILFVRAIYLISVSFVWCNCQYVCPPFELQSAVCLCSVPVLLSAVTKGFCSRMFSNSSRIITKHTDTGRQRNKITYCKSFMFLVTLVRDTDNKQCLNVSGSESSLLPSLLSPSFLWPASQMSDCESSPTPAALGSSVMESWQSDSISSRENEEYSFSVNLKVWIQTNT